MNNIYTQFKGNNPFASQAKMLFHGDRTHEYLTTGDMRPVFCEVNLTNQCNLKCKWCFCDNYKRDNTSLNKDLFMRFCCEFQNLGGKALTYSGGGEPTRYKDFIEVTNYAISLGLDLGLMTNGTFHKDLRACIGKSFQWVRFSVDTLDQQKYYEMKRVRALPAVIDNILNIKQDSPTTKLGLNCNVNKDTTPQEVFDLIDFIDRYDIDYLQFRPVLPRTYLDEKPTLINKSLWDILFSIKHERINLSYDKYCDIVSKNHFPFKSCEAHRLTFILDSNGDVKVCMYYPQDDRFTFGNIQLMSLKDIWTSGRRQEVIKFLQTDLNMHKECQLCCKLYELNKMFEFINQQKIDINFL